MSTLADDRPKDPMRIRCRSVVIYAMATIALLGLLLHYAADLKELMRTARQMRLGLLPIPIALVFVNLLLSVIRWRIILQTMGHHVALTRGLGIVLASWPFAIVSPARASDLLRAVFLRPNVPLSVGTASVIVEKLVDVHSLCLLTIIGALGSRIWVAILLAIGLLCVVWGLLGLSYFGRDWQGIHHLPRVSKYVRELYRAMSKFPSKGWSLVAAMATSLLAWINAIGVIIAWLAITNARVNLWEVVLFWPLASLVASIPVTIAGMGTRDAVFLCLLELSHPGEVTHEPVLMATIGYSVATTWLLAMLGIPFAIAHVTKRFGRVFGQDGKVSKETKGNQQSDMKW